MKDAKQLQKEIWLSSKEFSVLRLKISIKRFSRLDWKLVWGMQNEMLVYSNEKSFESVKTFQQFRTNNLRLRSSTFHERNYKMKGEMKASGKMLCA